MPINRVSDIIIAKDVASGEGFIRVLNDQMAVQTVPFTITDSPVIYLEQVLSGGTNTKISLPIHGAHVRKWSGRSAANAVLQRTTIAAINLINSQEYGLYITMTSDKDLSQGNRRYYAQYISDATATAAEIAQGIVDAINSPNFAAPVNAVRVGNDFYIEANTPGVYFTTGRAIGFDSTTTTTLTNAPDPGIGTYDQILALEDLCKGYEGYLGERRTFVGDGTIAGFTRPTYFATGTAGSITGVYDIYVIDHNQPIDLQGINASNAKPTTTYICVPAGAATFSQAGFEAILNPWMASTPTQPNDVNL